MKSIFITTVMSLMSIIAFGSGETLVLEGVYQNKNIYVNNCSGSDGIGFSVSEIRVNGELTSDEVHSSAFEIDLSRFTLNTGEKVTILIKYDGECKPKVLNPGALQPKPTFKMVNTMTVTSNGLLEWSSTGEQGILPYTVEQFKWNKWVKVGEVNGIGTPYKHDYKFLVPLVSGQNKFRVVQKNSNGERAVGKSVSIMTQKAIPSFEYLKKQEVIVFSTSTSYEVFDIYGQIRKRGMNKEIDLSNLDSGEYYLNYDNTMTKIRKK